MTAVQETIERMREQRKRTQERLKDVAEEHMLAPTTYGKRDVTVRYMFYRLIAHEVEHTIHIAKALDAMASPKVRPSASSPASRPPPESWRVCWSASPTRTSTASPPRANGPSAR